MLTTWRRPRKTRYKKSRASLFHSSSFAAMKRYVLIVYRGVYTSYTLYIFKIFKTNNPKRYGTPQTLHACHCTVHVIYIAARINFLVIFPKEESACSSAVEENSDRVHRRAFCITSTTKFLHILTPSTNSNRWISENTQF